MGISPNATTRVRSLKKTSKTREFDDSVLDARKLLKFLPNDETNNAFCDSSTTSIASSTHDEGSLSSNGSTKELRTTSREVKFDKISIRTYNITAVEHPCCASGVPIGLSWEYNPCHTEYSVDGYEKIRNGKRKSKGKLLTTDGERYNLLLECDVPLDEIMKHWVDAR